MLAVWVVGSTQVRICGCAPRKLKRNALPKMLKCNEMCCREAARVESVVRSECPAVDINVVETSIDALQLVASGWHKI